MATVKRNNDNTITVIFNDGKNAKFSQPNETHLKHALARARKDPNGFADVLVANCLVEGDKKIADNLGYLAQINQVIDEIFGKVPCTLVWVADEALVEFEDGKTITLKPATRTIYGQAQAKAAQNPLNYLLHILSSCHTEGDSIKSSPGHLLGFSDVAQDFIEYTGEKLGN